MQAAGDQHVQRAWGRRGLSAPVSWEAQEGGCEGSRGRGRQEAHLEKSAWASVTPESRRDKRKWEGKGCALDRVCGAIHPSRRPLQQH